MEARVIVICWRWIRLLGSFFFVSTSCCMLVMSSHAAASAAIMVNRTDWGSVVAPLTEPRFTRLPLALVYLSQTALPRCQNLTECIRQARLVQRLHVFGERKWPDIGYKYLYDNTTIVPCTY